MLDANADHVPADLVRRQLDVVDERIRQTSELRLRLLGVLDALERMVEPSTTEFLRLIEERIAMNQPLTPEQFAKLVDERRRHVAQW